MEITLNRLEYGPKATIGKLFVDGAFECLTLEDVVRADPNTATPENEGKIYGETAIPAGRYRVVISFSQRFQKLMLGVEKVPGFTGIRIHSGNTSHDTLGCILVGEAQDGPDHIHGGSIALPVLFDKVKAALGRGEECWITVADKVA